MLEGVIGVATWDEKGERLCFVPDKDSPGYREAAERDGEWERWVVENPVKTTGHLVVLEIVEQ